MTHPDTAVDGGPHFGAYGCRCTCPLCELPGDVFISCICPYETPEMGCNIHVDAAKAVEAAPPAPTLRELAEKVVDEIKADMDPDKYSDRNMAPWPDPVGALVAFAEAIKEGRP